MSPADRFRAGLSDDHRDPGAAAGLAGAATRWSGAPVGYRCPFCDLVTGHPSPPTVSTAEDVVHRDDEVLAFVAARWWPDNPGHVLVIPVEHVENLYELPDRLAVPLLRVVRAVAVAMKTAYGCDGVTLRQNNERAGGQTVWHHHTHVVPRWRQDFFRHHTFGDVRPAADRARYADLLRAGLAL